MLATVFRWWQTSSACLGGYTWLHFICSSWIPDRGCGSFACLLEFGGSHKNTNIYICCTEGKFFRNMIKDGLTGTKCYASLNERYKIRDCCHFCCLLLVTSAGKWNQGGSFPKSPTFQKIFTNNHEEKKKLACPHKGKKQKKAISTSP